MLVVEDGRREEDATRIVNVLHHTDSDHAPSGIAVTDLGNLVVTIDIVVARVLPVGVSDFQQDVGSALMGSRADVVDADGTNLVVRVLEQVVEFGRELGCYLRDGDAYAHGCCGLVVGAGGD